MKIYYQKFRFLIYRFFPFLERYHNLRQFVKFCTVGFSNLVIDFFVYFFLTRFFGLYFLVANIGSFLVAVSWSFYWNKRWTFQHEERKFNKQYIKFIITNLVGIVLQTSLLYIFHINFEWGDIEAKLFAVVITSFWNFAVTKFWAFR